ncbi:MAG: potassium transporter [Methanoregulaceae archaeon PtaB.Bin152]|nr:MAG: potassium transporter [Methanoregulaceae archaeon PtaB.Bin152]
MGRIRYFSAVLGELGEMLVFISPLTLLPLPVAVIFREWDMLLPLALVPALFFCSGSLLNYLPRRREDVRFSAALCSVALVWLAFALISCIPFMLVLDISLTDALFESMAGWTGTAFSFLRGIDSLPESLLFWRTYMQWIGGLAVISLSLTLAFRSGLDTSPLFRAERRAERILPSVIANGKEIWAVYILLTVVSAGLIMVARVPLWDALNLALSGISTGGFIPRAGGILSYQNPFLEAVLIPVMIFGSTPFTLYYMTYRSRKISFFSEEQVRLLLIFLTFGALIVIADLFFLAGLPVEESIRQGIFMTTSAVSTTGFQNANPHLYPAVTVVFLTMLIFIGGSSGSAAGGVRLSRIALGYRGIIWWFRRAFVRSRVLVPFKYEGRNIPIEVAEPELSKSMLVIILSVITVFIATMIVLQVHITAFGLTDLVFEIVSALSSCGMTTGYVNPSMPFLSKWVFIVVMWVGRLEILPVIVLGMGLVQGRD